MSDIKYVLEKVGFEHEPDLYYNKKIILRNSSEAVLWVNKVNGHGILDPEFWLKKEEYESEYRNKFSANLNSKTKSDEHFKIYKNLNERQAKKIAKFIDNNTNLLEIGSSFGGVISQIINNNEIAIKPKKISIIEPNKEDCNYLISKFNNKVNVYNDFFDKNIKLNEKFNLIINFEVLEHIEKPFEFINSMYSNLDDNGKIIVEVPNHNDSLLSIYKNEGYEKFYYHNAHIHYYTPESLKEVFNKCKFTGEVEGFQMYPLINQIFWILNNKPQENAIKALNFPDCINTDKDINLFFEEITNKYNDIIEKKLMSDCLMFIGKKAI